MFSLKLILNLYFRLGTSLFDWKHSFLTRKLSCRLQTHSDYIQTNTDNMPAGPNPKAGHTVVVTVVVKVATMSIKNPPGVLPCPLTLTISSVNPCTICLHPVSTKTVCSRSANGKNGNRTGSRTVKTVRKGNERKKSG